MPPRKARGCLDFEAMYQRGELDGTDGFISQVPAGTAMWRGEGWNKQWDYTRSQLPPDKTRPAGRSNRTGE